MSQSHDRDREVEVHIKSLKSGTDAKFKASESATLDAVWNRAVSSEFLNEPRNADDILRCQGGDSLMDHLSKTIGAIKESKICTNLHFQIKGPSGGARVR